MSRLRNRRTKRQSRRTTRQSRRRRTDHHYHRTVSPRLLRFPSRRRFPNRGRCRRFIPALHSLPWVCSRRRCTRSRAYGVPLAFMAQVRGTAAMIPMICDSDVHGHFLGCLLVQITSTFRSLPVTKSRVSSHVTQRKRTPTR